MTPRSTPTAYELGKSGWVHYLAAPCQMPSIEQLWLDESYRAQAPKKLAVQIKHDVSVAARLTNVADPPGDDS